jgi:uncharacterized protein (TIGR02271 family)
VNPLNPSDNLRSSSTIAAHFRDPETAERAINALTEAGIPRSDIGVALWDNDLGANTSSAPRKTGWAERFRSMFSPSERQEYSSHDGLSVMHDMGLEGGEAERYQRALHQGGVLVTVNTQGRSEQEIRSILESHGSLSGDDRSADEIDSERAVPAAGAQTGTQRIELLGEMLRVHKERVQRGTATLRKEVVSEQQNVEVPVVREELVIERHPVEEGREATGRDFEHGKEVTIPLTEEQVRVEKRPVVREAVDVGKRQVQEVRNVSDEVRHEELRVEGEETPRRDTPKRKRA